MAIISSQMANLMDARIGKAFFNYFNMYADEYTQWCNKLTSGKQYERDALFGEVPMPDEVGEYETIPETAFVQGPYRTWTHKKYAYKLVASNELVDDELFPVVVKSAAALGKSMRHRYEVQGAYDLNQSFTISTVGSSNTADETLCATSHASFGNGSAQANNPATDVTLGVDSFWAGIVNFHGLKDHEDNPIMKIPTTLIGSPSLERRMIEMLDSTDVPYLSTNELNAIRKKKMGYVIGHYLTSTTAWWITTNEKAIRFYVRWPVKIEAEKTLSNQSRTWYISTRISHGPMDWYDIYGTDGAA